MDPAFLALFGKPITYEAYVDPPYEVDITDRMRGMTHSDLGEDKIAIEDLVTYAVHSAFEVVDVWEADFNRDGNILSFSFPFRIQDMEKEDVIYAYQDALDNDDHDEVEYWSKIMECPLEKKVKISIPDYGTILFRLRESED